MIDAVIFFGVINILFEFVVISMVPPRIRLRILGSKKACTTLHIIVMCFVLTVHWGTLIGTMSGFFSFILSIATVLIARNMFGYIEDGVFHRRIIGYTVAELQTDKQRNHAVEEEAELEVTAHSPQLEVVKQTHEQLAAAKQEYQQLEIVKQALKQQLAATKHARQELEALELGMWLVEQGHDIRTIKQVI